MASSRLLGLAVFLTNWISCKHTMVLRSRWFGIVMDCIAAISTFRSFSKFSDIITLIVILLPINAVYFNE